MEIRRVEPHEMPDAIALVWDVFLEFNAPDYSRKGIATFREFLADPVQRNQLVSYGAYLDGRIVGVLALKARNHISLFFVKPEYQRRGVATALFAFALPLVNAPYLTVNASPYAVEVYRRLGFVETDLEQEQNGIRFIPMRYTREPG